MFRLVGILLLLGSCSARWYCGEGYVSGIVSYAMAFGNEDINECCRQHDDAYVLAENHPYAKWEIRRLADEKMLRCMTENDRGIYRSFVSNAFYGACRLKNVFCEMIRIC